MKPSNSEFEMLQIERDLHKGNTWVLVEGHSIEELGYLPQIFNGEDERKAADQVNARYAHGGGWNPFRGFKMRPSDKALTYPGDPAQAFLALTLLPLTNEMVIVYPHAWVVIMQADGSWEVCRMD